MERRLGDASSSYAPSSSSQQADIAVTLAEGDNLSLKTTQDKPISFGAKLTVAKDKLRELKDALTSVRASVSKQEKENIKLKNELANLYTELLEVKEAESGDRKQQSCLEGEAEKLKALGHTFEVRREEIGTEPPITCERVHIEREGVKENNNVGTSVTPLPPSYLTSCDNNEIELSTKESPITTTTPPSSDAHSSEPSIWHRSRIWMSLTNVYVTTGNAEKIAELIEVQAAQLGDRDQLKKQGSESPYEDWDNNDDSWRVLDPLSVVRNEALAVEMLGMIRSCSDSDYVEKIFSTTSMTLDDGTTREKRRHANSIMCPFELNGVCNDDGCQYLHSDTSRSNTRRYKQGRRLLQGKLSLPIFLPFRELISRSLATATSNPLKHQLTPQRHPLMHHQPATSSFVPESEHFESMDEFVPLGPNSDDDSEEEASENVIVNISEEGSMGWPPGGVDNIFDGAMNTVIGRHNISSKCCDENLSPERLFTMIAAANFQPWIVALSRSTRAPTLTTELRTCDVRYWEQSQNTNRKTEYIPALSSRELSQLEAFLVAHPENSSELWLLYVLYLLPRTQGDDSLGAVLRAVAVAANPTLFQLSRLVPGSLNPALRALARALNHPSNTSCEALWVLYLGLKESCTTTTENSQHFFINLHSHALQAIPQSPRIWSLRLDFVRQHCGAVSLFSALQEAYNMLLDIQACNNSASTASMHVFLVMYTVHSMLISGRLNAAAAFFCSILNVEAGWVDGDIEMDIVIFRPNEIALQISSATSEQRALLWITLAHVLAFGSIPRPAECLALTLHLVDEQHHEGAVINFLFSLLKWKRGLLESKVFPRLRGLPHLLALLRNVLCGAVLDIFSLNDDEYDNCIACGIEDNSPPARLSMESLLSHSIGFDCPPVYKSVLISNMMYLEMVFDSARKPGSHLPTTVSRSFKLVEKACSKTGLMIDVIHVIHDYLTFFGTEDKLVKNIAKSDMQALEFVLTLTAQNSSNSKDAVIQTLELFLGERADNLIAGSHLHALVCKQLSHWTDSGFRHESEAELRSLLACIRIFEGLGSTLSRSFHVVTASGFSNMDPALRRLAWLCVLELCIEYKSNCSNRDGDVDNEHQPSLFKVVTEEEKQNAGSISSAPTAHTLFSSVPLHNTRFDPTLVVLRALDPSELIPSPSFSPKCTNIAQSVLTSMGASRSPSHFELEAYICRILTMYIEYRKDNIHWEFVDALVSDKGGETVGHSTGGGNAIHVAPASLLLLSQWILGAQAHDTSLSLTQVKHLCDVAIRGSRKGTTVCSALSRVAAAVAVKLGDQNVAQHTLCISLKYEPSNAGLWEQLAWMQACYAPLQELKMCGRTVGLGASNAGVVLNLKCRGDEPLKTEAMSASLRHLLSSSSNHFNPTSSLNLASSLVSHSVPCSILLLTGLQRLSLASNTLVSLPEGMERLSLLRILDVSNNSLKSFPLCIWSLSSLETLRMGKNLFTSLPNEAQKLQNTLIELDLSGNSGLGEIPQVVLNLTKLQTLKVRCCDIGARGIPLDLAQRLPDLYELDIGENPCLTSAVV